MNILKRTYAIWLRCLERVLGIDVAKGFDAKFRFHRNLNLVNPVSLADKVSYLELHESNELKSRCTDKWEVREYVKNKGLGNILNNTVGGPWSKYEDIDFSTLPDRFALKATHGCKMNYMVTDKSELDFSKCRGEVKRWLDTTYGTYSMEPHYRDIPHRVYAEEYLGDMSNLIDYKFHCLNGVPQFVIALTDRKADGDKAMEVTINLFDIEWNPIFEVEQSGSEKPGKGNVARPKHYDEMVSIAKKLSEDFKFVRVDLYDTPDGVLFGELTFSPATCVFPYLSEKFLLDMGKKLKV